MQDWWRIHTRGCYLFARHGTAVSTGGREQGKPDSGCQSRMAPRRCHCSQEGHRAVSGGALVTKEGCPVALRLWDKTEDPSQRGYQSRQGT